MICSRTWFTSRNSIVCECESLFFTGLETNLVDNDDLFKYKSGGWTGASASQSSPTNIFSPVESTCADHNPSSDTSPPPEAFLLLTPSGRASAQCNTDFTFTLEKTVSLYEAVLSPLTNPLWCFIEKHRWQLTRAQGCQSLTLMQWSLLLLHESLAKPFPPLEQTLR